MKARLGHGIGFPCGSTYRCMYRRLEFGRHPGANMDVLPHACDFQKHDWGSAHVIGLYLLSVYICLFALGLFLWTAQCVRYTMRNIWAAAIGSGSVSESHFSKYSAKSFLNDKDSSMVNISGPYVQK